MGTLWGGPSSIRTAMASQASYPKPPPRIVSSGPSSQVPPGGELCCAVQEQQL